MEELNGSKTAVIFDPYLDTLGGGERYTLTVAQVLLDHGWQVHLAWKDQQTIKEAQRRFGLNLERLMVSPEYYTLFNERSSFSLRFQALKNLDLVFIVSDGSVPILFGKKTFLHYQVPFTTSNRSRLINRLKLLTIDNIVVNSQFTKKIIDKTLFTNKSVVLYPPVDVESFGSGKKTNTILNVGRFASPSHSKRQDVLIETFKKMVDDGLKNWELVLVGGQSGSLSQLDSLQEQAKGYPISFVVNPDFDSLKTHYAKAKIYWHAAGFEVDEALNPESVEHFGITTVEAMSAGAVPIVHSKGGQKEIVTSDTGFLWDTTQELESQTLNVINDQKLLDRLSKQSVERSKQYSQSNFSDTLMSLLK